MLTSVESGAIISKHTKKFWSWSSRPTPFEKTIPRNRPTLDILAECAKCGHRSVRIDVLAVLHGDLAAYVRNDVLRHPLLPSRRYDARFSGLYNRELQVKMADMEMAEVTRNWPKMIWLHERAFRPEALQRVADKMTDSQYWAMVAEVWLDADIIDIDRWTDIWTLPRAYRDHVMTVDEH